MKDEMKGDMKAHKDEMKGETKGKKDEMKGKKDEMKSDMKPKHDEMKGETKGKEGRDERRDEGSDGEVGVHLLFPVFDPHGLRSVPPSAGRPVSAPATLCKNRGRAPTKQQTGDPKPEETRSWPHSFTKELKSVKVGRTSRSRNSR